MADKAKAPRKPPDPEDCDYTYRVEWDKANRAHIATVDEFPSLSWSGPFHNRALYGLQDVVAEVIAQMEAAGEPVPPPTLEVPGRRAAKALRALFGRDG